MFFFFICFFYSANNYLQPGRHFTQKPPPALHRQPRQLDSHHNLNEEDVEENDQDREDEDKDGLETSTFRAQVSSEVCFFPLRFLYILLAFIYRYTTTTAAPGYQHQHQHPIPPFSLSSTTTPLIDTTPMKRPNFFGGRVHATSAKGL